MHCVTVLFSLPGVGSGGLCSTNEECGDDMVCVGNPGNQMCKCKEGYAIRLEGTCGETHLTFRLCNIVFSMIVWSMCGLSLLMSRGLSNIEVCLYYILTGIMKSDQY